MARGAQHQTTMSRSKIIKYQLEEDVIRLKSEGKTYEQIANLLNADPRVPTNDPLNLWVVERFLKSLPALRTQAVRTDRRRLLNMMNRQVDMYTEIMKQYNSIKILLDEENSKKDPDYKAVKAYTSEARELLKMINDMQAEINSQENVKQFMNVVLNTVNEIAPQCVEPIVKSLKVQQESMFMIGRKSDNAQKIE